MKQIKTLLTAVCLCIFLSVPMTAFAAPEPQPATWTESMEGKPADAGEDVESAGYERVAEAKQETGTSPEAGDKKETKQEAETEQAEAKTQAAMKNSGTLRIQNAAAGNGERLSGAVFAVYEKDGAKAGEVTLQKGTASLSLPAGDYYLKQLKAPSGYGVEPARIVFAISKGEITLAEVTSEIDLKNVNPQDIIPKTGQTPPVRAYALSTLCFAAALLCAFKLRRMNGGNRRKGGARSWQS